MLDCVVMFEEVLSGERVAKSPMKASIVCIACAFPYGDLGSQCVLVVQPAMQALAMHNAHVRLRHVQPTAVFGRVMKLDLVQDASSLLGRKGFLIGRYF